MENEICVIHLYKYMSRSDAHRIQAKLNQSVQTRTYNEERVAITRRGFSIRIDATTHWRLEDIWSRVEEMFAQSETNPRINLDDWRLIARVVLQEIK